MPKMGWVFFVLLLAWPAQAVDKFLEVSPGLFRSGRPAPAELALLKQQYGIKTILDLENSHKRVAAEERAAVQAGITFLSIPLSGFWAPRRADVEQVVQLMADPSRRPLLVHCKHGEDRTGVAVGLYRVFVERMPAADAYREMLLRGFHRILFPLDHFFRAAVGIED